MLPHSPNSFHIPFSLTQVTLPVKMSEQMRKRSKIKCYPCVLCGKSFTTQQHLTVHWKGVHLGERDYKCTECDAAFSMKHGLDSHMRIHTNEKPFSCDVCFETFRHRYTLVCHQTIHTGLKQYKCTEQNCTKQFSTNQALKCHVRSFHEDIKHFQCSICQVLSYENRCENTCSCSYRRKIIQMCQMSRNICLAREFEVPHESLSY